MRSLCGYGRKWSLTPWARVFQTTAALLSFITYEMATHPEWQQKAREEVLAAFGTPKETEMITNLDKLESLQVLNACLKETLRMYPR